MWCRHVEKARLINYVVYGTIENREKEYGCPKTKIIYICTKCSRIQIDKYDEILTNEDFVGTKIGEMLDRYNELSSTAEREPT